MSLNPPLRHWQGQRVWLIGASSGIGLALAEHLHALGAQVVVSARQAQALQAFAAQHPGAQALALDVCDAPAVQAAAQAVLASGPLDVVCYCAGHYRAMRASTLELPELLRHQRVNTEGPLHVLAAVLPAMLQRGQGHLSWVSSVAGFRALPRSLAYGPTKAALTHLAEALYLDVRQHGLGVSVIHPGFVQTPLTAQNDFHMPALISPAQAARAIVQGWAAGAFEIHFPKRFTRFMKLLRLLPYGLYFALLRRMAQEPPYRPPPPASAATAAPEAATEAGTEAGIESALAADAAPAPHSARSPS